MRTILAYLWRFWMVILGTVLTILFFLPVYLLSIRQKDYKACYFFIRLWAIGMFYGMGFRYKLISKTSKKIDKNQAYVIISNHTSIMDVMLPCILFPNHPLCYVGKKELVKIPIFGTVYKRVCVMVDRSSARSRADVYRRCAERGEAAFADARSSLVVNIADCRHCVRSRVRYLVCDQNVRAPGSLCWASWNLQNIDVRNVTAE